MSKMYLGTGIFSKRLTCLEKPCILCYTQRTLGYKHMSQSIPEVPGKYLERKYMIPNGLSQNKLARDLDVDPARICQILQNRRSITADTALRLAKYFKTPARFWYSVEEPPKVFVLN